MERILPPFSLSANIQLLNSNEILLLNIYINLPKSLNKRRWSFFFYYYFLILTVLIIVYSEHWKRAALLVNDVKLHNKAFWITKQEIDRGFK